MKLQSLLYLNDSSFISLAPKLSTKARVQGRQNLLARVGYVHKSNNVQPGLVPAELSQNHL